MKHIVQTFLLVTLIACERATPNVPTGVTSQPRPTGGVVATVVPTSIPKPTSAAPSTIAPQPTPVAPTTAPSPVAPTATTTVKPTVAPVATSTSTAPSNAEFVPKVRTVWNTVNGSNTTSGTCASGAILPVYGLVEITPQGETLIWKNQEPQPYNFKKTGSNQYQYKGPSGLGLGEQTMTLTFTGQKSLKMVHSLVPTKDPGCTHTFSYTGEFRWERP